MSEDGEPRRLNSGSTCPKCESRHWMTHLPFVPKSNFYVCVIRGVLKVPSKGVTAFTTSICGDCGYSEFHATDYKEVYAEWRKHHA